MRTTRGKPVLDTSIRGDRAVGERLGAALAAEEPVERATHGFHTWPAGLHPDAARDLLAVVPPGPVLDPFCGGGTTLVEAALAGRAAFGGDLSQVACLVARTRTRCLDDATLTAFRSAARRIADAARLGAAPPDGLVRLVGGWYDPHVLAELTALHQGIAACQNALEPHGGVVYDLLRCTFSSLLIKVSNRVSDTVIKQQTAAPRPPETTAILFHKKARELGRRLTELRDAVPANTPSPLVRSVDARDVGVPVPGGVAAVVTSPPYPGVYDYLVYQELREGWLGFRSASADEIGPRRSWRTDPNGAMRAWRRATDDWMSAAGNALRPGGWLVIVIGDGLVDDRAIGALTPTLDAADGLGLERVAAASLLRPDHARDTGRWEHVIALRRPLSGSGAGA